MKDQFIKGMMLGIGLASLAAKDAIKRVNELTKKGALTKQQARKLLTDVKALGKKHHKHIERKAMAESKKQVASFKRISKRELAALRKTLARLEKRL
ncbi:MAG: hypothetical protein ABIH34_05295 [Nanoarchaeota archaeon]